MSDLSDLELFLQLARASELRRQPMDRDKLLVLAGVAAAEQGHAEIADRCRLRILEQNPGHLLRHFPSLAAACGQERFDVYLKKLHREFPREKAELMLRSLNVAEQRRPANQSDVEYAGALLDALPSDMGTAATAVDPPATPGNRPTNWRTVGLLVAALLALLALIAWLYLR